MHRRTRIQSWPRGRRASEWSSYVDSVPDLDGVFDLLEARHQRQAEVAFAAGPERFARTDDDPVFEQPREEHLGVRRGYLDPEVDGTLTARNLIATRAEIRRQAITL